MWEDSTTGLPQFLSIKEVCTRLCVSKGSIYLWLQAGRFPAPVKLGPNCVRWKVSDIQAWVEQVTQTTEGG